MKTYIAFVFNPYEDNVIIKAADIQQAREKLFSHIWKMAQYDDDTLDETETVFGDYEDSVKEINKTISKTKIIDINDCCENIMSTCDLPNVNI